MDHGKIVGTYVRRFDDGRREVRWVKGQLREESFYAAGGPLGSGRAWAENGQLTDHGNDKVGLHQGPHAWWNEDGDLLGVALFEKGDALIELTHPNGQASSKGAMKAGERDGPWKSWATDGTLVFDGVYSPQGASIKRYFDNGILYETATYDADGLLDGPHLRNDASGNKEREGSYAANLLEGDWIFYQQSKGQLVCFRRNTLVWVGSCAAIMTN